MVISDFARLGQVSVRMLRHYDAIGLLVPAHVDPASGFAVPDDQADWVTELQQPVVDQR